MCSLLLGSERVVLPYYVLVIPRCTWKCTQYHAHEALEIFLHQHANGTSYMSVENMSVKRSVSHVPLTKANLVKTGISIDS